jgi:hypothetical protein
MDIVKRIRTNPAVIAYALYTCILILAVIIGLHQNLYKQLPKDPTYLYGNGYKKYSEYMRTNLK